MNRFISNFLGIISLLVLALSGCVSDQLPEPEVLDCTEIPAAYDPNVRDIIDRSCAYSGCHLDTAPGNYTTYEGLKFVLDNGSFRQRVFVIKDDPLLGMPPNNAPTSRPRSLTTEELALLRCWVDNGYPKN